MNFLTLWNSRTEAPYRATICQIAAPARATA